MFPFRTSSVFRSRWMALLWCAGFIWMAIDVANRKSDPSDNATAAATAKQTGGAKADPWARPRR